MKPRTYESTPCDLVTWHARDEADNLAVHQFIVEHSMAPIGRFGFGSPTMFGGCFKPEDAKKLRVFLEKQGFTRV
jgi:hypothetical protein